MRVLLVLLLALVGRAEFSAEADLEYRLNRFAGRYNHFLTELRTGRMDLRAARQLSQLWRDVEHSGMWPREK